MAQIRIIAGTHRSRRIEVVDAEGLRPTTDRIREVLFNWLGNDLSGLMVLDLFAGSGGLGFESASRGAQRVDMVDASPSAIRYLKQNQKALALDQVHIWHDKAANWLNDNNRLYDLIFLDPPFAGNEMVTISDIISDACHTGGWIYREYNKNQNLRTMPKELWQLRKQKNIGQVTFELWQKNEPKT